MPLTTTTYDAIRDQMATTLHGLTPTLLSNRLFEEHLPKRRRLRDHAAQHPGEELFRSFEIRRGAATEPGLLDPDAVLRNETVTVTVAYPTLLALYGTDDLDEVERLIRGDARQIRDAVFSAGNYVSGQLAALPIELDAPDTSDADCYFQEIAFTAIYYEGQTLT